MWMKRRRLLWQRVYVYNLVYSKLDEEYIMVKAIESSNFSDVSLCISRHDGLQYAIKRSKKTVSSTCYQKTCSLIDDMNLLRKFNVFSNFCVNYKEAWQEEGLLIIKQEYCENGDLLNYLEKLYKCKFNPTIDFYWDLIFEMLNGVKYIHDCGYIHLDIKPSNFLVSEDGCIKLADFGLSKKMGSDDDDFEGDTIYLAPEILKSNSKEIGFKCDIFSLGLSIMEILFNVELPQTGVLWNAIRSENFEIPSDFYERSNLKVIPIELIKLIKEMLSVIPNSRPDIMYFYENYFELKNRYNKLVYQREYQRVLNPKTVLDENNFIFSRKNNSFEYIMK